MSWFDEDQRRRLDALADELIPEAEGMPAATQVGATGPLLRQVLNARPDLAPEMLRVLRASGDFPPREALEARLHDLDVRLREWNRRCVASSSGWTLPRHSPMSFLRSAGVSRNVPHTATTRAFSLESLNERSWRIVSARRGRFATS